MKRLVLLFLLASPAMAQNWQCHQGDAYAQPTPVGVVLWKIRLAWLFGVRCEKQQDKSADVWSHIYHPDRLQVIERNVTVTGTIVDATHGKRKQGCRSEADGDLHCWLKLDPGLDRYINAENVKNQGGNLVWEPICQHRVTQEDAKAACKNYKQAMTIPPVGSRVAITGDAVLDTQHGHKELHPVFSILTLGKK